MASNPEGNFFRRREYIVTQAGSTVSFEANGKKFSGAYDQQQDTLTSQIADWLPAFQVTRRTSKDAPGFYPRAPSDKRRWVYSAPVASNDGWSVSTLEREGVDRAEVGKLGDRKLQADPSSSALRIQSLLIARYGRLILEKYFYGFSQERVHDMRSAGKTAAPILVGLAGQQGIKLSLDTPVYPLFSAYDHFANFDERKKAITLKTS